MINSNPTPTHPKGRVKILGFKALHLGRAWVGLKSSFEEYHLNQ
jgi:hypothetical protein